MDIRRRQKSIVIILILLFIVASVFAAVLANKKALKADYKKSSELTLLTENVDGKEVNKYVDEDGKVTFADDKKYAFLIRTRDDENRVVLEQFLDENEKTVIRPGNYYAVSYSYDENRKTTTYLDENLKPVNITAGYSSYVRTTINPDSRDYIDMYFDSNGNPITNSVGCYGVKHIYDDDLDVEISYLDEDLNPMNCNRGYSKIVKTYNENKRVDSEMYFDTDGNPAKDSNGEYGIRITYNADNKREKVTSLDSNGQPMMNSYGYAKIVYTYDSNGNISTERFYDVNDEPCVSGKRFYGVRHDGERVYYLDKNGSDVISVDSILGNFPFMVSVFGILVCVIFIIAPKKINVGLMVLYFLFIMYETILYRISHKPTMNMELFWSYKQFFSNEGLRIEILNNIWLFVPYSLGLLKTIRRKKIVIVLLLLPLIIEIAQYVFGIGLAEFDDLVSNGLGELIGVGIWMVTKDLKLGFKRRNQDKLGKMNG